VRYGLVVLGYVVMPEHIHLLISEPDRDSVHGHGGVEAALFTASAH
jgi:REP element-mobilizing transposase RayT